MGVIVLYVGMSYDGRVFIRNFVCYLVVVEINYFFFFVGDGFVFCLKKKKIDIEVDYVILEIEN